MCIKLKLLTLITLTLILTACREPDFIQKEAYIEFDDSKNTTIPYEDANGLIVAEVTVNSSAPLKFIIDTGSPETFVFLSERSKAYNKPISNSDTTTLKTHTQRMWGERVQFSDELELKIANVTLKDLSIGEWPAKLFFDSTSYDNVPYDGILGYDLLKFIALEINRTDQTITLHKPDAYSKSEDEGWTNTAIELIGKDPHSLVNIQLTPESKSLALNMHLDLGNMGSIWVKTNKEKGIVAPAGKEQVVGQWLDGTIQKGKMWPVHQIRVLGHKLRAIPMAFIPGGHPRQRDRAGFVGARELKYFDLVIDYTNHNVAARLVEKQVVLSKDILNLYAGAYSSEDLPLKTTLNERGGLLYIRFEGQDALPLINSSISKFVFEPMKLSILFPENEDGLIDYTTFIFEQDGARYSYKRNQE